MKKEGSTLASQAVLKTVGGKASGGSTPSPSAKYCCHDYDEIYGKIHPPVYRSYRGRGNFKTWLINFCPFCGAKIEREDANGEQG